MWLLVNIVGTILWTSMAVETKPEHGVWKVFCFIMAMISLAGLLDKLGII